jgi:predicted phosphodiesterase
MSERERLSSLVARVWGKCDQPAPLYVSEYISKSGQIAVLGDTQRTMSLERRLLWREQNDAERAALVAAIGSDRPDLLVHLGDLVAKGSSVRDWQYFDQVMKPVQEAGIAVLPIMGNHDYWGSASLVRRNFSSRFSHAFQGQGYSRRYQGFLLVLLDSNRGKMSNEQWHQQEVWFARQLANAEIDPAIAGVLVFCHHPPFTNSRITGDEWDVQHTFVSGFSTVKKTLMMISGHAHAYERFKKNGKVFLVAGGGGGPRVPLLNNDIARHQDLFDAPSPRPFHYLLLRLAEGSIAIEVKGFDKGENQVRVIDRFTLKLEGSPDASDVPGFGVQ